MLKLHSNLNETIDIDISGIFMLLRDAFADSLQLWKRLTVEDQAILTYALDFDQVLPASRTGSTTQIGKSLATCPCLSTRRTPYGRLALKR